MDEADVAARNEEQLEKVQAAFIKKQAAAIPKGEPGYCEECGHLKIRLVKGMCAGCRDELTKLGLL